MLKKIISLMICFILVLLTFPYNAATESKGEVLYFNRFNNLNDGAAPNLNMKRGEFYKIFTQSEPSATDKSIRMEKSDNGDMFMEKSFESPLSENVVVEVAVKPEDVFSEKRIAFRDPKGVFIEIIFASDGNIKLNDGTIIDKYRMGRWTNLSIMFNIKNRLMDVYVDGSKKLSDHVSGNEQFQSVGLVRFQLYSNSKELTSWNLDNIKIYTGNVFMSDKELAPYEENLNGGYGIFTADSSIISSFGDGIAMINGSEKCLANGKTIMLENPLIIQNGDAMIPIRLLAESLGATVTWSEKDNGAVLNHGTDIIKFSAGEAVYRLNCEPHEMSFPVAFENEKMLVPAKAFAESMGYKFNIGDDGMLLIGGSNNYYVGGLRKELKNFLKYTRPSPEKLIKDIKSSHPRILVSGNDDFERIKKLSTTDENVKAWYAVVKADADAIIPLEPYAYELPDGLRLLAASRGVKERSLQLAMAYRISGEKKYADRLWAELNNASLYPDWNSKKHFLDSSEMGVAFAIGYDWLYDYWTAEQRTILETAMKNFLLAPAFELYEGRDVSPQNWPVINHNWNVVCNGGITMVAAATMEVDPEYNGKILSYALRSLEYMLGEFAPDGAWPEGVSYWDYAVTFLSFMIGTLDSSFGTDYGYFNIDGIDKTGYYANYMTGAGGVFNFHDSSTGFSDTPELFWFAKKLKDKSLVTLRLEDMKKYNYKPSVQDILWYDKSLVGEKASLPLDIYYRNVETVAVRDTFAHNNGIFASLHAGKNSANHSHMDAGTFVLDAYGERWAEDLGSDDYNLPGYFGPERYNYYRIRTEGHNCFVINPNFYCGQEWSSDTPIVKYDSKPRGAFAVTDVTSAYLKDVTNAKRGMMMDSDRKRLIVQDEVVLPAPSEYWWFMHTKAKIAISDDGRSAVLTKNSKNLILNIIGENSAKFTQMPATPFDTSPQSQAQNKNVGVNKLAIHLSGVDKVNMAVSMVPSVEKVSPLEAYTFVPMNKWNIPDGEIKYANMENIMIDGKPLDGVTKDNFVYEVPVNYDVKSVPSVSVDENFNVVQGRRIGSFSKIIPKGGGENYYVLFKPKPLSMNEISKAKEIPIKGVLASDEPEPENIAINTLDGKSETRWSAEGTQWIQYELEKESEIDFIGIAWWLKNNRKFSFLIETSKDGETWEFAYDGQSAGVSDEKEIYLLKKSMAKFIRITGYGNTENAWNSITEVSIYSANK